MHREHPEYVLDHATISRYGNMIEIVERLVDMTSKPDFDRERHFCRHCLEWTTSKGESRRPRRMGAKDPTESCTGCVLSMLELVGEPGNPVDLRAELDRVNQRINDIERSKSMRKRRAPELQELKRRARGLQKRLEEEEEHQREIARRHRPRVMVDHQPGAHLPRQYVPLPVRPESRPGDLLRRYMAKPGMRFEPGITQGELRAGAVCVPTSRPIVRWERHQSAEETA